MGGHSASFSRPANEYAQHPGFLHRNVADLLNGWANRISNPHAPRFTVLLTVVSGTLFGAAAIRVRSTAHRAPGANRFWDGLKHATKYRITEPHPCRSAEPPARESRPAIR